MQNSEKTQSSLASRSTNRNHAKKPWSGFTIRFAGLMLFGAAAMVTLLGATTPTARAESLKSAAEKIFEAKGCKACHYIPGIPGAAGTVGPSLKNLKNRPRIAGGVLENTDENLREWLKNPKSVKPNTMMPDTGLEDSEIEILLKFFDTL